MNKVTDKPEGPRLVEYRKDMKAVLNKGGFRFAENTPTEILERMITCIQSARWTKDDYEEWMQYKREIMEQDEQHEEVQ